MGLFLFLPQNVIGSQPIFNNQVEVNYSSSNDERQLLIIDSDIKTNHTSQAYNTSKPQIAPFLKMVKQFNYITFDHKLLYFGIGNAIELKLTSTIVIFPFHFFT